MRISIAALALMPLLFAAPPALADESPAEAEKLICKSKAKTGTRFPVRTCRTRAEWERMAVEHQRAAADMIDRPVQNRDCGQSSVGNPATGEMPSGC